MKITTILLALAVALPMAASNFVPATSGGWTAHADAFNSDALGMSPPYAGLVSQCHDPVPVGPSSGLGVSSNGFVVAASYTGTVGPYLKVYGTAGITGGGPCTVLWTSSIFDNQAFSSAPLVGSHIAAVPDEVIQCDDTQCAAFTGTGTVLWDTCLYGGTAPACLCSDLTHSGGACTGSNFVTSPQPLNDVTASVEAIFLATNGSNKPGKIFEINTSTGALMGSAYLGFAAGPPPVSYITNNTPCVINQDAFVVTNLVGTLTAGRLYSVHVANGSLTVNWFTGSGGVNTSFNGPSGGSPLCGASLGTPTIFDDGVDPNVTTDSDVYGWNASTGAVIFACVDSPGTPVGCGGAGNNIKGKVQTNFALDPSGNFFWGGTPGLPNIQQRSVTTGAVIHQISTTGIIPGELCTTSPGSTTSIAAGAGPSGHDLLIIGLQTFPTCTANAGQPGGSYVAIFDTTTRLLIGSPVSSYWQMATNISNSPGAIRGQFAIVTDSINSLNRIAVPSQLSGLYLIGVNATPARGVVFK